MAMISAERLRELLNYDPETGAFTWRAPRRGHRAGGIAGHLNEKGYVRISVDGRRYAAHRLAWLYMTGEWPEDQIDHKDLSRANNRWENLRPATNAQNQMNSTAKIGTSGRKGVYWYAGKWQARIWVNGKAINLGRFEDKEKAAAAYVLHARKRFGEFARFE
jgi:hypothetical protein